MVSGAGPYLPGESGESTEMEVKEKEWRGGKGRGEEKKKKLSLGKERCQKFTKACRNSETIGGPGAQMESRRKAWPQREGKGEEENGGRRKEKEPYRKLQRKTMKFRGSELPRDPEHRL